MQKVVHTLYNLETLHHKLSYETQEETTVQ